ncbi:hypothetical protein T07_1463 [Trichinella nelsoni]|uniref:Uncharacterized protein n=1 Tax=Trichinella nelsoni TaxID=6336 RepID=A0A0V0REJ7_9BILA|nr:hypothetical protein T07_1463 [Trichinella nelsoni]
MWKEAVADNSLFCIKFNLTNTHVYPNVLEFILYVKVVRLTCIRHNTVEMSQEKQLSVNAVIKLKAHTKIQGDS